jgi:hypothetical protein
LLRKFRRESTIRTSGAKARFFAAFDVAAEVATHKAYHHDPANYVGKNRRQYLY